MRCRTYDYKVILLPIQLIKHRIHSECTITTHCFENLKKKTSNEVKVRVGIYLLTAGVI